MTLQERLAKLEPRERSMLLVLAALFGALLFLGVPFYFYRSVSQARDDNQEIRDYLDKVAESRAKIEQKKSARDALLARYAKTIPANFVDDTAKANGVVVSETSKKPDVPHGKKFTEHVQVLRIHKVGLLALSKMLERLETAGYPLSVTRLNIKPHPPDPDSYDVEMGISTYERKPDAVTAKPGASAKPDGSADPGDDAP